MQLTEQDKKLITMMNHSLYTVSFIESWLNRPAENVIINAPAALQQIEVEGFVTAIKALGPIAQDIIRQREAKEQEVYGHDNKD